MTSYFIQAYTASDNLNVLGVRVPFSELVLSHYKEITAMFEGQMMLPYGYGFMFLIASFIVLWRQKNYKIYAQYFLGYFIFTYLFYLAIYHHNLKVWYLQGNRILYLMVFSLGLSVLTEKILAIKNTKIKYFAIAILGLFLIRNFYLVLEDKALVIINSQKSNDPKNASNMLSAIDWVYEKSNGKEFEAYNYVPEVYDYPYQYLYWWHGNNEYGYLPSVASYSLNDIPQYYNLSAKFLKTSGGGKSRYIGLIYENLSKYEDWLLQFDGYCVIEKEEFFWKVTAEWRQKCE